MEILVNIKIFLMCGFFLLACFLLIISLYALSTFKGTLRRVHIFSLIDTGVASFLLIGLMFINDWLIAIRLFFILFFILVSGVALSYLYANLVRDLIEKDKTREL